MKPGVLWQSWENAGRMEPWCFQPGSVSSNAFILLTSHHLGINPAELKHRPQGVPTDGEERGTGREEVEKGGSWGLFLGPGSEASTLASQMVPPPDC